MALKQARHTASPQVVAAVTARLRCECGNERKPGARSCTTCAAIEAERVDSPRKRIMRLLSRSEWIETNDICIALDVFNDRGRWRIHKALSRLVRSGVVERRGDSSAYEYRRAA